MPKSKLASAASLFCLISIYK